MTKQFRYPRIAIGTFVIAFAAIVFFSIEDRPGYASASVERIDPSARIEAINVHAVIYSSSNDDPDSEISIEADEMRIYEGSPEQQERIEWSGSVEAFISGKIILADKLIYTPDNEEYVFTGRPAKVIESCREVTAEEVIIDKSRDTIVFRGRDLRTNSILKEDCDENSQKETSAVSFLFN